MRLPELIEIVPLDKAVRAEITVPGSKSITNRALILAALADGETTLQGALWSEDTQVMAEALQKLGFEVKVEPDPDEFCNRTITVIGLGGKIPNAGTEDKPLDVFVGNAGTAARFLSAFVCLGKGVYRLDGVARMRERPQAALFDALRELGYRIETANNKLPAVIHGTGPRAGKCKVSIEESSQFASALLLCSPKGRWQIEISGQNEEESPYVTMTSRLIRAFPTNGIFEIEPDASSGSYFVAADYVGRPFELSKPDSFGGTQVSTTILLRPISVRKWPKSGLQVDERFPGTLKSVKVLYYGLERSRGNEVYTDDAIALMRPNLKTSAISRHHDLGDSIMTMMVLAPFSLEPLHFTDLGRLRLQECERVAALRTELMRCGAKVIERGDMLEIFPSKLHGAEIETYNDHRMAMCFAILGLKVPGIKIKNPACVKKTFPNFFQKLATEPPHGLGVTILDGKSGRKLGLEELFAV
jgi:3-phosphoshikimate 1-carboxyvinyltransferase